MNNLLHKIGWKVHQRWDTTEIMIDVSTVVIISLTALFFYLILGQGD